VILAVSGVSDFMERYGTNQYEVAWVKGSGHTPFVCGLSMVLGFQAVSMAAFYTGYAWTAPALFPRRKYGQAVLSLAGVCLAMVATRYVVEFWILKPLVRWDNYFGRPINLWWYSKNCVGFTYNYALFGIIVYFIVRAGRVQQERVSAELAFLKSQVNPHFLFNTINDIYALVYQKSEEAPESLLKLSGLLRYMLYEDGRENVSLERELAYLKDYLDLQRIGAKQHMYIDFHVEGDTDRLRIAPLLLIPFAENIVKHGVIDNPDNPARLCVDTRDGHFHLSATNGIKMQQKDKAGGIGLNNVRRRLELLYPGRHTFRVTENGSAFECLLDLTLNSVQP
jgi:hypothetical protein